MTDERQSWAQASDPRTELGLMLGAPVTDDEIDRLCELAWSGAAEAVPDQAYVVNRIAEIRGFPVVVIEEPPGRYRLHADIRSFATAVFQGERSRRQAAHSKHALEVALAELPARYLDVLKALCAPPRPLESAARGRETDDPNGFVSAVNSAARSHGITEPVVEVSAGTTVRAILPPDLLVGAVFQRLHKESEQRQLGQLADLLSRLGPDETALLRHLTGYDIADEAALRCLDPAGDLINEQARNSGLPVLLRRDDEDRWHLNPPARFRLRDLWGPPVQ